jgi:Arc/MetJ-type ribon-helix-helix transcriptional regulator
MTTINISLPTQLKNDAETLIELGHYVSFSDLVRDAIRKVVTKNKYDILFEESKRDYRAGRSTVLKNKKDIDNYMNSIR